MEKKKCVHYWILDNLSYGICKYCGAEEQFTTISDLYRNPTNAWRQKVKRSELKAAQDQDPELKAVKDLL